MCPPARCFQAFTYAIERSCVNKAEVVAADELEGGVRATLNLGHTFGHAVETCSGYGAWLHGEAVAAGTVMASDMSRRLGWITPELDARVRALLLRCRLPAGPPEVRGPAGGEPGGSPVLLPVPLLTHPLGCVSMALLQPVWCDSLGCVSMALQQPAWCDSLGRRVSHCAGHDGGAVP